MASKIEFLKIQQRDKEKHDKDQILEWGLVFVLVLWRQRFCVCVAVIGLKSLFCF